jgi:hypothetical protein
MVILRWVLTGLKPVVMTYHPVFSASWPAIHHQSDEGTRSIGSTPDAPDPGSRETPNGLTNYPFSSVPLIYRSTS